MSSVNFSFFIWRVFGRAIVVNEWASPAKAHQQRQLSFLHLPFVGQVLQQPRAGQDGGACIHRRILARILAAFPAACTPRRIEAFVSAEALESSTSSFPI